MTKYVGPGGVAIIVDALTDNRNRTASDLRMIFSKSGGNMGETGSVNYMFEHVGLITYPVEAGDADTVFEAALEAGAENVESTSDGHEIYTSADDLHQVARALEPSLGEPQSAKLTWHAKDPVPVDEEAAVKLFKLLDALDDNDDVQEIFGNYDVPDAIMEKLGG